VAARANKKTKGRRVIEGESKGATLLLTRAATGTPNGQGGEGVTR
jgi:hypothetical protein